MATQQLNYLVKIMLCMMVSSRMVLDAILWSGTGSVQSPYFVLSPLDGQSIIEYIFGGSIGMMGSKNEGMAIF